MTAEQKAAYVMAQVACAMAEIAGMQAENIVRIRSGAAPAYSEQAFNLVIQNNCIGHNAVLELFRS